MDHLLSYILMALAMSMLPGTDTVLIIKNTLHYGIKAGRYTIFGMATGLTFWTIIAVLGLAVVIARSVFLFNTIKYVGACYLFYLGVRAFFMKGSSPFEHINKQVIFKRSHHYSESFLQGAISNILNPKTVLVYITFMPQFIDLNGNITQQLILLGLILILIAVGWFLILVFIVDHLKNRMKKPNLQIIFQKLTGLMLMGFGLKTVI